MKRIGMVEAPVEAPQEPQNEAVEATKAEMIQEAEKMGIELTAAEKRMNKEKLADAIAAKAGAAPVEQDDETV